MLRSMYSGISGLRVHQTKLDVIGNNIANVNTVGFKASRVVFQEVYNQTLKSASAPSGRRARGGSNPQQIGLGVSIASVDVLHTSAGVQRTDKATDLAIEGDGFFVVSDGVSNFYTRAGNFDIDAEGYLVTSSGLKVQGWTKRDRNGNIEPTGSTRDINLAGLSMPPKPTSEILFIGNLDSTTEVGGTVEYTTTIVDSLGEEHNILLTFERSLPSIRSKRIDDVDDLDGKTIKVINGNDEYSLQIDIPDDGSVDSVDDLVSNILNPALESGSLNGSGIKSFEVKGNNYIEITLDSPNLIIQEEPSDGILFDTRVEVTTAPINNLDFSDDEKNITVTDDDGDYVDIDLDEEFETLEELKDFIQEELDDSKVDVRVEIDGNKLKFIGENALTIDDDDNEWDKSDEMQVEKYVEIPEPNRWNLTVTPAGSDTKIESPSILYKGTIEFDGNGIINPKDTEIKLADIEFNNGAKDSEDIVIRFDEEKTTQHDRESNIQAIENDGYGPGTLDGISIDSGGRVIGIYSNGQVRVDALLGIAKFSNPSGLTKLGNNLFQISANSGQAEIDAAGVNGRGEINPGALEMSNVDLANEFTEMITAQRGFQANSRIITTSDEVLQELVNLKR